MTQDFHGFGLPAKLVQALDHLHFKMPTPIQAKAIPLALQGRDILGSAQTGTGKTAAYSIPLITKLMNQAEGTALVLTPTRELATQVLKAIQQMIPNSPLKTVLLIGGDSIGKQIDRLKRNPRIIVGTPGRVNDHLMRKTLNLNQTAFLVLDETDRMLDMGFSVQLDKIAPHLPAQRQTLMFSATLPSSIIKLANKYLTQPERIAVGSTHTPVAKIKQELIQTSEAEKYPHLLKQLEQRNGSVIVFVKTKRGAQKLAEKLSREDHEADTIHGDLPQRKRERVIQNFRDQKFRILVATDVAARGLDISHVAHVINYDLPQCPEDYIHRIGRTGRAGAEGEAVNLITPSDSANWKAIHRLMNPGEKEIRSPRDNHRPKKSFHKKRFGRPDRRPGREDFKANASDSRPQQKEGFPRRRGKFKGFKFKKPAHANMH